jgi:hypothetical protein
LADAVLHYLRCFGRREITAIGGEVSWGIDLRAVAPQTRQLRHLFFERHPRKQIGHALLNG